MTDNQVLINFVSFGYNAIIFITAISMFNLILK